MRQLLAREDGIALVMAVILLAAVTATSVTVITLTGSGARSADRSKATTKAYHLAEAGIAEALSKLEAVPPTDAPTPPTITLPLTAWQNLDGGQFRYSGTFDDPSKTWTISATGSVPNPGGPGQANVTRTLSRNATVQALVVGATAPEWDRLYHGDTGSCLTIDTVTIPASVTSAGDLCLIDTAKITGAASKVEVGDDVDMDAMPGATQSSTRSPCAAPAATNCTGWLNPTRVASSNNSRASVTVLADTQSAALNATGYAFAIPANAVILGIVARIEGYATGGGLDDDEVRLLKAGAPSGNDDASSTDWAQPGSPQETTRTYGGSNDLWGTTWTPAQINATNFGLRLRVDNDNTTPSATRVANVDHIQLQVYYQVPVVNASIGVSGGNVLRAEIVGTCTYGTAAPGSCGPSSGVYAGTITSTPPNLQKPQVDMAYWYQNAKPGPMHDCTTGSFPGGFDNDTTYNVSLPDYGNANEDIDQITPSFISYSCKVIENGVTVGELTWNHVTHLLIIKGTIFIDGNVRFDKDGQLVNYQGRAIIYAAGDIEYDEIVCAGGDGSNNCWSTMTNWDPEQNMMIILSGGDSEYDQGEDLDPAAFQGVMYADDDCIIHEAFRSSGPIICDSIEIPYDSSAWPSFYAWPSLQSLIAGQMYGSFANADDYTLLVGEQSG